MSGVVPALSDLPIEITFQPKSELTYNYNLMCNVKRKARPLVLNVKGEGYKIHHSVRVLELPPVEAQSTAATNLDWGDFFINEKKTKVIQLTNSGEFNFDFVWKRPVNKYVTITPETGSVKTGGEIKMEINYLPIAEHELKNYKATLSIVSGPRYDFFLSAKARRPGVKLNQTVFDFGPCFVTGNPTPIKKMLYITNVDKQALAIETNFEKKPFLDFQVTPGQVIMPVPAEEPPKKQEKS
jgi:hydrocephalus-inducing protein